MGGEVKGEVVTYPDDIAIAIPIRCAKVVHIWCLKTMAKLSKETLLEQARFELRPKSGGGLLSYEVWGYQENGKTVVTRYNLAYINHSLCNIDNGRVLGFDNAHDYHHRHFMGEVTEVAFNSYEETLERFQQEWMEIVKKTRGTKS